MKNKNLPINAVNLVLCFLGISSPPPASPASRAKRAVNSLLNTVALSVGMDLLDYTSWGGL
jgi:hypothetical protein